MEGIEILRFARLCQNPVHGSTGLTTNGSEEYRNQILSRSPRAMSKGSFRVFTQSVAQNDIVNEW